MRKKRTNRYYAAALVAWLLLCVLGVSAQPPMGTLNLTPARASVPKGSLLEKRNLLNKQLNNRWRNMMVQTPITSLTPMARLPLATPTGATFRSNIIADSRWPEGKPLYGLYDFQSTSPDLTNVYLDDLGIMHCEYGGAWIGDYYYMVMAYDYGGYGQVYIKYVFNMATMSWEASMSDLIPDQDITYLAWTNTPFDKKDGVCYGYFYDSSGTSVEFCSMRYSTMKRQLIAVPQRLFIVLAINDNDGQLYGIDMSGGLYKIDKKTGAETFVGNTGITPSNYHQAADIDPSIGVMYWTFLDENLKSGLAMVDLATGETSICYEFSSIVQFADITLTGSTIDPNAPAVVQNLMWSVNVADYNKVDLAFTMPTLTNDGQTSLEGKLSYTVSCKEEVVAEGSADPGEQVQIVLDGLPLQQVLPLTVAAGNDVGESGLSAIEAWAGKDTPKPVRNLTLASNDNSYHLTWDAPDGGVHGGYVNADDLRYEITLFPGNQPCGVTAEKEFSITLPGDQFAVYYFKVRPLYEGSVGEAEAASSNKVQQGSSIVPPYAIDFSDPDLISDYWTITDGDHNGLSWSWDSVLKLMRLDLYEGGDDWLISPPIYLEAGHVYTAQFDAYTARGGKMEMTYGTGDNVNFYKVLINPTPLNLDVPMTYGAEFEPAETGVYHFALHEMSNYGLYTDLTGFRVSDGSDVNAPDAPTDLAVVPGEKGALTATLTCTLPQSTINGQNLGGITQVTVYKNGEALAVVDGNCQPGAVFTYVDDGANAQGGGIPFTDGASVQYSVRAANEAGLGRPASASAYVGHDTPQPPLVKSFTENSDGSVTLVWENDPVGVHGGYVDTEDLTTVIYNVENGSLADAVTAVQDGSSYTFSPDLSGDPAWYYLALTANDSDNRFSESSLARLIKGTPVEIPFAESFAGGAIHESRFWWGLALVGENNWSMNSRSSDGDGGSLAYVHKNAGDEAVIGTRRITLKDTENPYLVFSYYSNALCSSILTVEIDRSQGGVIDPVASYDMNETNRQGGWKKVTVDLSDYRDERYIIVRFHAKGVVANAGDVVGIDEVSVNDIAPNDLAVELQAPDVVYTGQPAAVKVKVVNRSSDVSQQYTARLTAIGTADGEPVAIPVGEVQEAGLAPGGGSRDYEFSFTATPFMLDDVTFKAEVEHEGDAKLSNNVAEAHSLIVSNIAPPITDLAATGGQPGPVTLTWGQPQGDAVALETVTDDFESYSPWALDFGEWESYDGDGGYCGALFGSVSYPNQGTPFAYIVFNPNNLVKNATAQVPQLKPHSGEQFASTIYAVNGGETTVVNQDNWLISPLLSGLPQTISFYAKGMSTDYPIEQFEVLYSLTDTNPSSFVKLGNTYTVNDVNNWSFFTVQLPEGAKYFAIRDVTSADDAFMLMIDDVSFTQVAEIGLDITGYNIYVDGVLYKTIEGDTHQAVVGPFADGEHLIYVTVLYGDGRIESPLSNPASVVTAIKEVLTETDLNRLDVEVFTPSGVKVAEGTQVAGRLAKGVYVVSVKATGKTAAFVKK